MNKRQIDQMELIRPKKILESIQIAMENKKDIVISPLVKMFGETKITTLNNSATTKFLQPFILKP